MTETQREQTIEVKELCIYILRRWRLIIVAALIGAVLLGGYRTAMQMLKGPQPVLTEEELEEHREQLDDMENSILDTQESIQNEQIGLSELQNSMSRYEELIDEVMESTRVSASAAVDLVEVNEKLAEKKSAVRSTLQKIEALKESIADVREDMQEIQEEMGETAPLYTMKDMAMGFLGGGLLGAFLAMLFMFLCMAFGKTLRRGEDLGLWYGLPLLCDLCTCKTIERQRHHRWIDRLLDRLEGIEGTKDPNVEFAVAAAKLQLLAKPGMPVMLAGTVNIEKLDEVYSAMRASLSNQIELHVAGNPMKQPEAVSRLSGSAVVLVEESGTSKIKEISQIIEFLNMSKTPVIAIAIL